MSGLRLAAVAGAFYESYPEELKQSIEECFLHRLGPGRLPSAGAGETARRLLGLVCPHAGVQYSGPAAAWAYGALAEDGIPDSIILLGTNHQMIGPPVAISDADAWLTPLGRLYVDNSLRRELLRNELVEEDESAHESEHSIEVQLPWLQYVCGPDISICPISIGYLNFAAVQQLAQTLVEALQSRNALIIASSDLSHYLPQAEAKELDKSALEAMQSLKGDDLIKVVGEKRISMCGAIPVAVMLEACRRIGATEGKLLSYYTSGDITGDYRAVVGYAALSVVG
jgi:MEMO1 family protein